MPLPARFPNHVAGRAVDDVFAEQRADRPADDHAVLILAAVAVERRRQGSRLQRVLDQRERRSSRRQGS
jgi:hypothetical protein